MRYAAQPAHWPARASGLTSIDAAPAKPSLSAAQTLRARDTAPSAPPPRGLCDTGVQAPGGFPFYSRRSPGGCAVPLEIILSVPRFAAQWCLHTDVSSFWEKRSVLASLEPYIALRNI